MEWSLVLKLLLEGFPAITELFVAFQEQQFAQLSAEQEFALTHHQMLENRETQLQIANFQADHQRATTLRLQEQQKILESWSLGLLPAQLKAQPSHQTTPLQVLLAPLRVHDSCSTELACHWSAIEPRMTQDLAEFLEAHYSLGSDERPTDFLAGAWTQHLLQREAQIKTLFEQLKEQPTLVLEPEVVGDTFSLRIAYWGLGSPQYVYRTVISRLPYRQILESSAKQRALRWQKTAQQLLDCGESAESIQWLGGNNVANLDLLEKELKWQAHGIETSDYTLQYRFDDQDFEGLAQLLGTCHGFVTGWIADVYHLVTSRVSPLLPTLISNLSQRADSNLILSLMQPLMTSYRELWKTLERQGAVGLPELALQLAEELSHLSDRQWAQEQAEKSLQIWLRQHGCLPSISQVQSDISEASDLQPAHLIAADYPYLQRLRACLDRLGETQQAVKVEHWLALPQSPLPPSLNVISLPFKPVVVPSQSRLSGEQPIAVQPSPSAFAALRWTIPGYSGKGASLAVSPDGELLVSASEAGTIQLWQLRTGTLLRTLPHQTGRILTLTLSPDGQILASVNRTSNRSCIQVWNLRSGELLQTLTGHNKAVSCLAISPDGQRLVSGGQKIKVWDWSTGQLLLTLSGHKKQVYALAISPDGQTLISSSADKTIKVWHLQTGQLLHTLTGHVDWVRSLAFSADGQWIFSGSDDHTIKIWHLDSGQLAKTLTGHEDWVLAVAATPDGQTLISGSKDHTIKLWSLASGQLLETLTGHKKWVYSLAVSPDGQTFASGSEDKTIRIWQAS